MNRTEIMNILPHRDDMLFDDAQRLYRWPLVVGHYTIRGDEFSCAGISPATCCAGRDFVRNHRADRSVLFEKEMQGALALCAGIDKARFRGIVRPGDVLTLKAKLLRAVSCT